MYKVDSMNKPGILLEVVQILTDLDLTIRKASISSDGGLFMDVFHVTDHQGNQIRDRKTIEYVEQADIVNDLKNSSSRRKSNLNADKKKEVLNAWHRIDPRTREALRRSFLSDLLEGYEKSIRAFVEEGGDTEFLSFVYR